MTELDDAIEGEVLTPLLRKQYVPILPPSDPEWLRNVIRSGRPQPKAQVLTPEQHPKPVEIARPARDGEVRKAPGDLRNLLEQHGWTTEVLYARGTVPGKSGKVVDLNVVRGLRGPDRIVATWEDGKNHCAYWNQKSLSVTELKKKVAE